MSFEEEIKNSKALEDQALAECNNEPIQIPGSIQAYGALLAFDFDSLEITYVSENLGSFLTVSDSLFGTSIREVLTRDDYHDLSNIASRRSTFTQREFVKTIQGKLDVLEVSLYRTENQVVVELIPEKKEPSYININSHVKWVLDQIKNIDSAQKILDVTVEALQAITQFDRVQGCKFYPDDSGEIVTEANNNIMESYLGTRFPAHDIPPIAREMLFKQAVRYLWNTHKEPIPVQKKDDGLPALNMTHGILRGTSPVHTQYLRNMGVTSNMTLPIIVKDKLWGLFAHHHHEEKMISTEHIYSVVLISQMVSMTLEQKIEKQNEEKIKNLQLRGDEFITLNQNKAYLNTFWNSYADKLKGLVACDGVAYQIDDTILTHENTPSKEYIKALQQKVKANTLGPRYHTENLEELGLGQSGTTRGVLVLQVHEQSPEVFLYFFRDGVNQKVAWAGDPKKDLVVEESGVRLHPRSSFNHFIQINEGQSENWNSETLDLANMALKKFEKVAISEKLTTERLRVVIQELNHRIRNIFGLVRSISRQSTEGSGSLENYVDSLEQRILALSKANDLLTRSVQTSVVLKTLLKQIIPPFCKDPENIILEGPEVSLTPEITPTMVLIIHELTTNAVKYGALSVPEGKINIRWQVVSDDLHIYWKEQDGPLVKTPGKAGFGTSIIHNAISYEFNGSTKLDFHPDGLLVEVVIPQKYIGQSPKNENVLEQEQSISEFSAPGGEINVLILEDDFLNAQDVKNIIIKLPVNEVNTFASPQDALSSFKEKDYHLALMDFNLRSETCLEVAKACAKKQIPFYYVTGYGDSFLEDGIFPKAPVIIKPISTEKLKEIVTQHISHDYYEK